MNDTQLTKDDRLDKLEKKVGLIHEAIKIIHNQNHLTAEILTLQSENIK